MFRTVRRAAALSTVATGAVVLAFGGLAFAHIETDPSSVPAGVPATVGFVVEHGCGTEDTTGMDIELPDGITDATAAKDGWTATVADGVVRFSGGVLDHDTEGTFEIAFTAPTAEGTVSFPTVQTCGDTEIAWIAATVPGQPEPEFPAPLLEITGVAPTTAEPTTAAPTTAAPTTAAAATTAAPTTAAPTTAAAATTATPTTAAPTTAAAATTAAATTTSPASTTSSSSTTTTTIEVTSSTTPADDDGGSNAGWWIAGGIVAVLAITGAILAARRHMQGDGTDGDGPVTGQ